MKTLIDVNDRLGAGGTAGLGMLLKGKLRVIIQEGETILLLWYKDKVFAIENRSPAKSTYSEGLLNGNSLPSSPRLGFYLFFLYVHTLFNYI
ncbi:hypothetical protein Ahy_B05g078928 isoform A [Arachis hypogaea]|uniref:Uncharacterized protein n=1 Tax=Arachis hypogaea TaxID=3818 RepID=A0A444Z8K9_ARAHY|nr:hypothetical protein Ahy_B05g078928 isoform A [Arachis hypogaea]